MSVFHSLRALSDELERERADLDYVMRWLLQTGAPANVIDLQAAALKRLGWPTHGRHCLCSSCASEDWTRIAAPCGIHGAHCPARYQPYSSSVTAAAPESAGTGARA